MTATGCCIFAMQISETLSFQQYWDDPRFRDKRPVRSGSAKMMVGDNIYHRADASDDWLQEDSHHSNPDGSPNPYNVSHDTRADRVLISRRFVYFGRKAPRVPQPLLDAMGYKNVRNYRVYRDEADYRNLIDHLTKISGGIVSHVLGDPFDFEHSALRYVPQDNTLR